MPEIVQFLLDSDYTTDIENPSPPHNETTDPSCITTPMGGRGPPNGCAFVQ